MKGHGALYLGSGQATNPFRLSRPLSGYLNPFSGSRNPQIFVFPRLNPIKSNPCPAFPDFFTINYFFIKSPSSPTGSVVGEVRVVMVAIDKDLYCQKSRKSRTRVRFASHRPMISHDRLHFHFRKRPLYSRIPTAP